MGTEISLAEVIKALKKLKNGKAVGVDNMKPELLDYVREKGTGLLHVIINTAWKKAKIPVD